MPTSYLITGPARGLGYALAKALAAKPENIVLALVRNKTAAEHRLAADNITNVHVLVADVTDDNALKGAAAEASDILGSQGLDVLIHNAAYVSEQTALTSINDHETEPTTLIEDTQQSIEVNVFGTLKATLAFLDLVRRSQIKKVVAISSGMGDIDMINEIRLSNAAPYAISKGALNVLIAKLNAAYAGEGILFMAICPGRLGADGHSSTVPEPILSRVKGIEAKFEAYVGVKVVPMRPEVAARSVLAAVDRQTLAGGFGGSFWSHNGTKRWS
ncbi:NAD(P)-binding protein [Aspergillus aculeatinus CBS 121060]|uniref:NAD(P)-binding protein n=1 Tax=Aspergillus aculeatinus CBS 121060 TaxID=1448322 RepID=A0ACD1H131_9EURO|nr:NAD(P)-binding protein [Aspergillus aculeatinus CBS 121060]RAH67253.1 NAD(P)-binding protein [Aspergillus aculeatinus CBS 121060]